MKKIFTQFWQWILKNRKRLIYWIFILLITQVCFLNLGQIWTWNEVFAQENSSPTQSDTAQQKAVERYNSLSFLNKTVYVLIYPMLLLAWKLVDNSLVYWEIFWFDAVLWKLWNIVKNLANFTLWFLFVYKIFKYLIDWKDKIKDILLSALIAWIWIQASWFIMAALIDVSTILTYWVWWLPISILKENKEDVQDENSWKYNPAVLKNMIYVDAKDIGTVHIYMTSTKTWENSWNILISECETFQYGGVATWEKLIFAPKRIYYSSSGADIPTDSNRCHYYGQVYYFSSLTGFEEFKWENNKFKCGTGTCNEQQKNYNNKLADVRDGLISQNTGSIIELIKNWQILQIRDAHTEWRTVLGLWTGVYNDENMWGMDVNNKWTWTWWATSRLQDIMDGNSYVGVFTALYTSLINQWKWIITDKETWIFADLLNTAISFWYVLAIWIPLIVVSIVFMIRICVLWIAIILSPFIVLASAFKEIWDNIFKWDFLEYFNVKNLIPIIFSPAIICFAVSMSTVLVTIIANFNREPIATEETSILWWLIQLDIWWLSLPLARLVISVFWVAITWFIVRAAIETTKIWESKIVTSLKNLATTTLWSIPIVPIPWKDGEWVSFIWASTAFGLNGQKWIATQITDNITSKTSNKDNEAVEELLNPEKAKEKAKKAKEERAKNIATDFMAAIQGIDLSGKDWKTIPVNIKGENGQKNFGQLSPLAQKAVIEEINKLSDKSTFGGSPLTIWNETYNFDTTNGYVLQGAQTNENGGQPQ